MRLTKMELRGFRRFVSEDLDLSEPLIALTGSNEAGKTSLLRAIQLLDGDVEVESKDITRGTNPPDDQQLLLGVFRLDEADRSTIRHLPGADKAQQFVLGRRVDGTVVTGVRPAPVRPTAPIVAASQSLERTMGRLKRVRDSPAKTALSTSLASLDDRLQQFRNRGWDETGADVLLEELKDELAQALADYEGLPASVQQAGSDALSALETADQARVEEHPHATMRRLLAGRSPKVIPFLPGERDLRDTYDLSIYAESPPPALMNVAALAGLNLAEVLAARNSATYGRVEALLDTANEALTKAMGTWSQSTVSLRLRVDENVLRLLVTTPDRGWMTDITERSDGLRSYIALIAAVAWARRDTGSERPTLLLLDEAEQHLHYDAQADLVEVLTTGQLASQVVYTTHSAGCLPEDLGAAVRVVLPNPGLERSTIQNWFWQGGPGFSPLLLGMGASSLAFTSARRAVLTEGASDMIALPSLLREALGIPRLGYQIAPGLAEVSQEAARDLDLEAGRVLYLVDGDCAGQGITKKLVRSGASADDILTLGGRASGLTLEDLLSAVAFQTAVRGAFHGSVNSSLTLPTPAAGRADALRKACETSGLKPPGKRTLAQEIVILAREGAVLSSKGAAVLRQLHKEVGERLQSPSHVHSAHR